MITAGIDIGAKAVRIVLLKNGREVVEKVAVAAGTEVKRSIEEAWQRLRQKTGTRPEEIEAVAATGAGRADALQAARTVTEVRADARGAVFLFPQARTVVDLGAEEGRAVRVDAGGRVVDFAINERCAAGAGIFIETMARALEVPLEDLGPLSLRSTREVTINAQCVVFAESELVTLVHAQTPKPDMARAIHLAIAERVGSMVRRVGLEERVVLIGGVAKNVGFVDCLGQELQTEILIPESPGFVGALGAALIAAEIGQEPDPARWGR